MELLQIAHPTPEIVHTQVDETAWGLWHRFRYADGSEFTEFVSHQSYFGFPLIHITRGRDPGTGRLKTARGVVAIGRWSKGVVAIGQFACGILAVGQFALGVLFGVAQFTCGAFGLGQGAICGLMGVGQFATGYVAIGQLAAGKLVLAQFGLGTHVWDTRGTDVVARLYFTQLWQSVQQMLGV